MQKGSKGKEVEALQIMLNLVALPSNPLIIDGDFGNATQMALGEWTKRVFGSTMFIANGEVLQTLEAHYNQCKKFFVVIDAGHGGLDPKTGLYTTPADNGKRYQHKGIELHTKDGWFFEGVENRIIAYEYQKQLLQRGVLAVMASHPFLDWWGTKSNNEELNRRGNFGEKYLQHGFCGFFHSIHSNAAPEWIKDKVTGQKIRKRTQSELDEITGCEDYTTKGETLGDKIAPIHIGLVAQRFGRSVIRSFKDKEADFKVISEAEELATKYKGRYAGMLEETFVYTAKGDAQKLTNPHTRQMRVEINVETALTVNSLSNKTLFDNEKK